MDRQTRSAVRERFQYRCGYCGVSELEAGAELTIDHFQPRSKGGTDEASNLVYCCHACNEFKGDFWTSVGPRRILHPENDDLTQHITELEGGKLSALTPTGEFHIDRMKLNRPHLVAHRNQVQINKSHLLERNRAIRKLQEQQVEIEQLLARLSKFERPEDT